MGERGVGYVADLSRRGLPTWRSHHTNFGYWRGFCMGLHAVLLWDRLYSSCSGCSYSLLLSSLASFVLMDYYVWHRSGLTNIWRLTRRVAFAIYIYINIKTRHINFVFQCLMYHPLGNVLFSCTLASRIWSIPVTCGNSEQMNPIPSNHKLRHFFTIVTTAQTLFAFRIQNSWISMLVKASWQFDII